MQQKYTVLQYITSFQIPDFVWARSGILAGEWTEPEKKISESGRLSTYV